MYQPSKKMLAAIERALEMREANGGAGLFMNWRIPDRRGVPVPEIYEALFEAYDKN